MPRYRFNEFVLSPRRRILIRNGREQSLIPRYFDLLVFLIERRHEAVHRRDIFDQIWSDVVVSDSALTQAIRTIRRTLGDDSRDARFVRTVSRHGYRFVFEGVIEEDDDGEWPSPGLVRDTAADVEGVESGPDAADRAARSMSALVVPTSPRLGYADGAVGDWLHAAVGAAAAGLGAGAVGGLFVVLAPGSAASIAIVPVLGFIGLCCGGTGGAAVAVGLEVGGSIPLARRLAGPLAGAALAGGIAGLMVQWLSTWTLAALVGVNAEVGGGLEGLVIGTAVGIGYTIGRPHPGDEVGRPPGMRRARAALVMAAVCGLAALALSLAGRPLVGGTIHAIAARSAHAQATLTGLARLLGEPDFGPLTRGLISTGEGGLFGLGLALGLTYRSKSRRSHQSLTHR